MSTLTIKDRLEQAARYLRLLATGAPAGALFDVRYQPAQPGTLLARFFIPVADERSAWRIVRLGERTDVYVGCVPRIRRSGTRQDISPPRVLWADCDHPGALHALRSLHTPPAMIISSGSSGHAHAYWPLTRPVDPSTLEHANRRLALALGADRKCINAARILRPPGTHNFKHAPPTGVTLVHYQPHVRYELGELLGRLPGREPPGPQTQRERTARRARPHLNRDPLQQIAPVHYIRLLTGRTPDRSGKIQCPFHQEDRTPSLQAYPTPEQGWACYGCTTPDGKPLGGDIYTLASRLWNIPARGRGFIDLRARLDDVFGIHRTAPAATEQTRPPASAQRPSPPPPGGPERERGHLRLMCDNDIEIDR